MAEYLIIVARCEAGLWEYLRGAFSGDDKIEIVLDRRWSDWLSVEPQPVERRRQPDIDCKLGIEGFALTRRQECGRSAGSTIRYEGALGRW